MPFSKGNKLGKGRQHGSKNKLPMELKEMILQALADAGGSTYLLKQSKDNPNAFLALIGRVLPLQVKEGGADPTVPKPVFHDRIG